MQSKTYRYRKQGGFSFKSDVLIGYHTNGTTTQTSATIKYGTFKEMNDVVTKPFVPGRYLVNSPMTVTTTTRDGDFARGSDLLDQSSSWQGIKSYSGAIAVDRETALDAVVGLVPAIDKQGLIAQASTSALAGVRRPELSGIVSIAEWRSTVASLLNPVNGALNFLSRNVKKSRAKTRKTRRNVAANLNDIADQHLTIIFGIMPFISDIQGILKALRSVEPVPTRMTSRGSASAHSRTTKSGTTLVRDDGTNVTNIVYSDDAEITVSVRAYQLYESEVQLQDLLGLNLSDIPVAVWQTATLSFVVDWFANVTEFIRALTPKSGINYLTSGYTITTVTSAVSHYEWQTWHRGTYGWNGKYSGGTQSRVVLAKQRVPCSLFPNTAIVLKSNMHRDILDAYKVTAGLSLLTQRLSKFL